MRLLLRETPRTAQKAQVTRSRRSLTRKLIVSKVAFQPLQCANEYVTGNIDFIYTRVSVSATLFKFDIGIGDTFLANIGISIGDTFQKYC